MIAVAAAVITVAATVGLAAPRDGNVYRVTAYLERAIGLFERSDVRVLGVSVGRVESVTPEGDRVKVVMRIDREIKVPAEATAIVVPISLISDRYVQLSPPYSQGPALEDGDLIEMENTAIPAELDDLLGSLEGFLQALQTSGGEDPGALSIAVTNLAAALDGTGDDLDETLGSAGAISSVVTGNAAKLDSSIVHLSSLVQRLSEKRNQIAALNTHLAVGLGAIAEEQGSLDSALQNIALLTEQLGSIVKAHRVPLEQDLRSLTKTTQAVLRHQESVVKANDWLHVLADGGEASHNSGGVHKQGQSNNPGISHVDVRDAHYGACPVPFIGCALLPGGGLPASSGASRAPDRGPHPLRVDPAPGSRSPERLPSLFPDPLELVPTDLPVRSTDLAASGGLAHAPTTDIADEGPGWLENLFVKLGRWLDTAIGGKR